MLERKQSNPNAPLSVITSRGAFFISQEKGMKTIEDLTREDVQVLSNCIYGEDEQVLVFNLSDGGISVFAENPEDGVRSFYKISFDDNGTATADSGDANPVEAGLDFYVELKRRGFAVPALDEVYGVEKDACIQELGGLVTNLEHFLALANKKIAELTERADVYSRDFENARDEIDELNKKIDELEG